MEQSGDVGGNHPLSALDWCFFLFLHMAENRRNIKLIQIFKNKKGKKSEHHFLAFFKNKKGMEIWQLVMIILAVLLLVFVVMWYGGLNTKMADLIQKITNLL